MPLPTFRLGRPKRRRPRRYVLLSVSRLQYCFRIGRAALLVSDGLFFIGVGLVCDGVYSAAPAPQRRGFLLGSIALFVGLVLAFVYKWRTYVRHLGNPAKTGSWHWHVHHYGDPITALLAQALALLALLTLELSAPGASFFTNWPALPFVSCSFLACAIVALLAHATHLLIMPELGGPDGPQTPTLQGPAGRGRKRSDQSRRTPFVMHIEEEGEEEEQEGDDHPVCESIYDKRETFGTLDIQSIHPLDDDDDDGDDGDPIRLVLQ